MGYSGLRAAIARIIAITFLFAITLGMGLTARAAGCPSAKPMAVIAAPVPVVHHDMVHGAGGHYVHDASALDSSSPDASSPTNGDGAPSHTGSADCIAHCLLHVLAASLEGERAATGWSIVFARSDFRHVDSAPPPLYRPPN